jgi:hypothetical protein
MRRLYAVDAPDFQQGLRRQMDIFHPEWFGSYDETFAGGVSSI